MARYGITYEEVAVAANNLLNQGRNPTMEAIRLELGSTGSFATINKYLNRWREQRLLASAQKVEVQEIIIAPDEVNRAVNSVWEQLSNQAQQQIDNIKQACDEKVAAVMQERQKIEHEKGEAITQLNQAKIKLNHYEADLTLLNKELNELRGLKVRAEERALDVEEALKALQIESKRYMQVLENINAESLQSFKEQLESLQKSYEKECSSWKDMVEEQRTAFIIEFDKLKVAKEKTERVNIKLDTELQQFSQYNKELMEKNRTLEIDLIVTRERQQEAEKQATILKTQIDLKDNQINYLKQMLDDLLKEKKKNINK